MPEFKIETRDSYIYFRKKETWLKELLIKLKLIKPKYEELGIATEIGLKGEKE